MDHLGFVQLCFQLVPQITWNCSKNNVKQGCFFSIMAIKNMDDEKAIKI